MAQHQIRHILDLSRQEKREFIDSFDFIMSDCDAVIWHLFEPIAGVSEALQTLKENDKKIAFISNNSVRSMDGYKKMFQMLKTEVDEQDIIHPAVSTVRYLKSIDFKGTIYCIGTEVFKDTLREAGYELFDGPQEPLEESVKAVIKAVYDKKPVDAVIVDIDLNLSCSKMMRAQLYLKGNPKCKFIVGATDYYIPVSPELQLIGPGFFIEILERTTTSTPIVLGKPGKDLSELVLKQYDIKDPKRTLFVGDMLQQDMGFGAQCGFQKLLVLTGGATKEELMSHPNINELPDYYADSFADFSKLYEEIKG